MISWQPRINDPCGRIECGPGWTRTREHSLNLADAEFWFVWRGRGWMRSRDREFPLRPGFCALMRPGGIYDAGHDDHHPLGIVYVHFDVLRERQAVPASFFAAWPEFFELADVTYWDALTRRVVQLCSADRPTAAALLRGALADLLRQPSLGEASPSPLHDRRIADIVARLPLESGILPSVEDLARETGLTPAHFSRLFRRNTGETPRDFLLRTRLARAQYFLRETNLSVGAIAERLGYSDVFFFSRQFKQKTGLSPLQYRRRQ